MADLTAEEIEGGCSEYVAHGNIGAYCRWKPALRRYGKVYCKRHDPVRTKAEGDERSKKYIADLRGAQQRREANDQRLRDEGYGNGYAQAKKERAKDMNIDSPELIEQIEEMFADGTSFTTFIRARDNKAGVEECYLTMKSEWLALRETKS